MKILGFKLILRITFSFSNQIHLIAISNSSPWMTQISFHFQCPDLGLLSRRTRNFQICLTLRKIAIRDNCRELQLWYYYDTVCFVSRGNTEPALDFNFYYNLLII